MVGQEQNDGISLLINDMDSEQALVQIKVDIVHLIFNILGLILGVQILHYCGFEVRVSQMPQCILLTLFAHLAPVEGMLINYLSDNQVQDRLI